MPNDLKVSAAPCIGGLAVTGCAEAASVKIEIAPKDSRLSRRLIVAHLAGGAGLLAASSASAQTGRSDSDPGDRAGSGRTGRTDNDPSDGPGRGRGASSGRTDSDPSDGPGRGRGGNTGRTDNDPSDGPGRGRGTQTGRTDSDPSDGAGRGRR